MDEMVLLLGELKQFKLDTASKLNSIEKDIRAVKAEVKHLNTFKWKLSGFALAMLVTIEVIGLLIRNIN